MRRAGVWALVIVGAVTVALLMVYILGWWTMAPGYGTLSAAGPLTGVAPGTIGCRPIPGDLGYSFAFVTQFQGVKLSDVDLEVVNLSYPLTNRGTEGPLVPLGVGARFTVLSPNSSIAGTWNYSSQVWTSGTGWSVPTGVEVRVILDTGELNNSTWRAAGLEVVLLGPYNAAASAGRLATVAAGPLRSA